MRYEQIYSDIYDYIKELEVADTHEHLSNEADAAGNGDILSEYLTHYMSSDLVTAGLPPGMLNFVRSDRSPVLEKWKILEPYWNFCRHTGYAASLDIAVNKIYGADRIDGDSIEAINQLFLDRKKPGHYKKVLKDISKIKYSVVACPVEASAFAIDQSFFKASYKIDRYVSPASVGQVRGIEKSTGIRLAGFEDFMEACALDLQKAFQCKNIVALKSLAAYRRSIDFSTNDGQTAKMQFRQLSAMLGEQPDGAALPVFRELGDYMMHFILSEASKRSFTLQIHTGLQEGNGNHITNSNPSLLSNLFLEYPKVTFDIFHSGYPYQNVVTALGKNFRNVYPDMCWTHIISPVASAGMLSEWLEAVPVNKILGFGGDYLFVDGVCGHLEIARRNISKALAEKVSSGCFGIERAKWAAKRILCSNADEIFCR